MAIHCRLSAIMGEKRLRMVEVAAGTGLAYTTVLGLWHDRTTRVDYAIMDKLCRFLNCQPGDLLVYVEDELEPEGLGKATKAIKSL